MPGNGGKRLLVRLLSRHNLFFHYFLLRERKKRTRQSMRTNQYCWHPYKKKKEESCGCQQVSFQRKCDFFLRKNEREKPSLASQSTFLLGRIQSSTEHFVPSIRPLKEDCASDRLSFHIFLFLLKN